MKKLICIVLTFLLCLGTVAFADDVAIKLIADNKIISTPTHVVNNRTLIPLRALMESIGATVDWVNETQTAIITRNGKSVSVQIGNNSMSTPEGAVALDAAPVLLNEGTTTYVPLRAICEEFDLVVDWDNGGTKTILVLSPEGCPYVDIYGGLTLEEYLVQIGATGEEFSSATGIDYESNKNKLYVMVDNSISLGKVINLNGYTEEEFCQDMGLDSVSTDMSWGEFIGNLTMKQYIECFTPALSYGMTAQEALESLKQSYGLGNEYTLETKFKYVRTIMETIDYEYQVQMEAQQKAQEEKMAADLAVLPELLNNKIFFTITLNDNRKMKGELYPDLAPITVNNFIKLCNENFYNGLIFHRVIDGFMIQGGGYDKDFNQKNADAIIGEFYANGYTNALKHEKGVISMARTDDPNSASSQFFIIDEASPHLDGSYAAFGKITQGLDVLEAISQVETETNEIGHADVPVKPVIIKSITINK